MAYDATEGVTSPATAEVSFTVNPKSNTATYKDMAVPSATLQVKNNTWTSILNNITFGHSGQVIQINFQSIQVVSM